MVCTQECLSEIEAHAVRDCPRECCGVLFGHRTGGESDGPEVLRALPCRNVAERPETSYRIDPAELIAAQREARGLGLEIIGFYHSHPGHPAEPSARDLEEAEWDGCSYLVISVEEASGWRQPAEARSFVLVATPSRHFEEEPLHVVD